jgi:TRAP-type C4-dicarboxylate transport system substrate-binding protein
MNKLKFCLLALFLPALLFSQKYLIRFATVAPEGSTWLNIMKEYDAAIRNESNGLMGFKVYGGGVAGDEKDVIRKIRLSQYHAAGFTGVGMGEITTKVRIMDAPFLFKKDYNEVDYIYDKYNQEMFNAFWENDFVLLGWAEVGFVYVFTGIPINSASDLKNIKMWIWQGDPVAESAFRAIGITPIPLALTDVFTSLQTGLINGFYTVPLAGISLQWYTKAKYILDVPLANSSGSVLISKKYWDNLPETLRNILLSNGRKYMRKLTELSRLDNEKSLKILQNKGLKLTKASVKAFEEYQKIGSTARNSLAGSLFPKELLDRFEASLNEYRKGKK